MSNTPDKKELFEEIPEQEEFSTIFSDPSAHRKTAEQVGHKKKWVRITAIVVALALLVTGTVLVITKIPEIEEELPVRNQKITVLDLDSDDFKYVTVTNSAGTFKFYSVSEKEGTSSYETVNWYLDGYERSLISPTKANNGPDAISDIRATREITQKTAAECGLDAPSFKVDIVTKKDEAFSVLIGSESPDKSGYYLKLSTDDKIYLVEKDLVENLTFDAIFFANDDAIPAVSASGDLAAYGDTNGALNTFDAIVITGKNLENAIKIEPNEEELTSQFMPYRVTAPTNRLADKVDEIFAIFAQGLAVEGAYAFEVNDATLVEFGLNDPDFTATMVLGDKTVTYLFAQQADGGYAVASDMTRLIKKVSAESLPFIGYKVSDFYYPWVCFNSINDIEKLIIKTPDKEYSFGIKSETDEDSNTTYTITYNGKTIDTKAFQDFYEVCISLSCADYNIETNTNNPDYTFIFDFKDDARGENVTEFRKSGATKYQYRTDGVDVGRVTTAAVKKVIRALEKLVEE